MTDPLPNKMTIGERLKLQAEFEESAQISADGRRIQVGHFVATKGTTRLGMHLGLGYHNTWRISEAAGLKKTFSAVLHNVETSEVVALMAEHAAWEQFRKAQPL